MKKITGVLIVLVLSVGLQTNAFSGNWGGGHQKVGRAGHGPLIEVFSGPAEEMRYRPEWPRKERRCFPAQTKVWINGSPMPVQVTVCKKRGRWVTSPIHITMGRQNPAAGGLQGSWQMVNPWLAR